jgi:hypothetical protein
LLLLQNTETYLSITCPLYNNINGDYGDDDDDNNNNMARVKWKSKVTPVIIGVIKMISKSFRKYLSNTPGMHEIKEPQKQPYWTLHTYFRKY